jgi:nucleoside 2-deoxyribosyltransferase
MQIGNPETDEVYDRLIEPTIRHVGLSPRRMDRLMHNESIDQKILTELQAAHVVVADLTFARPSVYWEAGYAERQVPVIYTCRRDHFRPRAEDEFGNYKVHFDLQTRNIIRWTLTKDRQFSKALEKRLRYVLRPIVQERAKAEVRKREEAAFAALAMDERRRRVVESAIRQARPLGFSGGRPAGTQYVALLTHDTPRVAQTALVVSLPKLTKSWLREFETDLTIRTLAHQRTEQARNKRKTVVGHGIVVSFGPLVLGLIEETFPTFERDLGTPWTAWSGVIPDWSTPGVPRRKVKVHVLGNIRSETQARGALKQVLQYVGSSGGRENSM